MVRRSLFIASLLMFASPASAQLHPLCKATMEGDVASIAQMLDAGAPVDECHMSTTPLMFAAGYGQVDAVRLLLKRGADPAYRDINHERALMRAAEKGHADVIELLIAAGEPADSPRDPYGISPLHNAALWGHANAARVLLAAGANPHNRDQTEETPLHAATRYGQLGVVALLLAAGADPNAKEDTFGWTPVHQAARNRNSASLSLLLDAGGDPERPSDTGRTPLHLAAEIAMTETTAVLIAHGADADARDHAGRSVFAMLAAGPTLDERRIDYEATASILADAVSDLDSAFAESAWLGFGSVAVRLAERGATATGKDSQGRSALAGAAASGGAAMLDLALALGADVDADGGEALAAAAFAGRETNVKKLLDLGVPVDARNAQGSTPLQLAAVEANVAAAALLIERGADRNPVDVTGNTIAMLMQARRQRVQDEIDAAGMSAALIPTDHLEDELARLATGHAAILALLGK